MNATDRTGIPGEPAPHPLGGFEERLLAELKFTVAGQTTADPAAMRPGSSRVARAAPKRAAALRGSRTGGALIRRARAGVAAAGAIAAAAAVMALLPGGPLYRAGQNRRAASRRLALSHCTAGAAGHGGGGGARLQAGTGRYWCTDTVEGRLVPVGTGGRELNPPGQGGQPSPASDYRYSIVTKSRMVECETPQGTDAGDFYQYLGARPATSADRDSLAPGWLPQQLASVVRKSGRQHPSRIPPEGRQDGWSSALGQRHVAAGRPCEAGEGPADRALRAIRTVATKREERQSGLSYRQIVDQNLFWNLTSVLGGADQASGPCGSVPVARAGAGRSGGPRRARPARAGRHRRVVGPAQPAGPASSIIDPATTMVLASEGFAGTPAVGLPAGHDDGLPAVGQRGMG